MTSKPQNLRKTRTTRARRRSAAIVAGALLLAPVVSSCGFNYATDRVNTISAGINDRSGEVDVLGAVVIANSPTTGVFVASLANNSQQDGETLNALSGDGLTVAAQPSIEIQPGEHVNLVDEGGIGVTGSLVPGAFVTVQLGFAGGQSTTMTVNVVRPCFQYSPEKLTTLKFPAAAQPDDDASGKALQDTSRQQGAPDPYGCDKYESQIEPDGHAPQQEQEPSLDPAE